MELIINNATYTLKPLNAERRKVFVNEVLSFYNYEEESFKSFMIKTQEIVQEKYGKKMTLKKVEEEFFKGYSRNVLNSIWSFLYKGDKSILKTSLNLSVEKEELQKFIEYVCNKIKEFTVYIKDKHNGGTKEDIFKTYSYLSRTFGWTFEEIQEMDELELLKAIENAVLINERESVSHVNLQTLSGAYVAGSKEARTQISTMNNSLKVKEAISSATAGGGIKDFSLSDEELKKVIREERARRS